MSKQANSNFAVFRFAAIICLVCSLVVSAAAVSLRSIQEKNALNEKRINILIAAGLAEAGKKMTAQEIEERFEKITPVVVNLESGELASDKDPATYNMYQAAESKDEGKALTNDPANIKRIAEAGSAYLLIENDKISRVILPVQGYGLWSTMYGFTALSYEDEGDHATIKGLTFYQQGETPGLGARITEPAWQAQWDGVSPYDNQGKPRVEVVKNASPDKDWQVDAISGATLTSRGVQNLMNFWLGEQGYKPFLNRIQEGEITAETVKEAGNRS